jgi:hypothetical protein
MGIEDGAAEITRERRAKLWDTRWEICGSIARSFGRKIRLSI